MSVDVSAARGRSFVVTGGNTGIGRATVEALVAGGARVLLAARSSEKTLPVIAAIKAAHPQADLDFLQLDLADFDNVRRAAAELLATERPVDVLINNAGLAGSKGMTKQGLELTVGTNHFGPYLFTQLVLPRLLLSSSPRIVNVASEAHYNAKRIDFDAIHKPATSTVAFGEYGVSKLMNVLHAKALARRHPTVMTSSLHPGVVASDVWRELPSLLQKVAKLFMITNEQGAQTSLFCATSPSVTTSGRYWDKCREKRPNRLADD
jgi:dehydrogenase/reductase SDR family protein 13